MSPLLNLRGDRLASSSSQRVDGPGARQSSSSYGILEAVVRQKILVVIHRPCRRVVGNNRFAGDVIEVVGDRKRFDGRLIPVIGVEVDIAVVKLVVVPEILLRAQLGQRLNAVGHEVIIAQTRKNLLLDFIRRRAQTLLGKMDLRFNPILLLQQVGALLERRADIIALDFGCLCKRTEFVERMLALVVGEDVDRYPIPILFFKPEPAAFPPLLVAFEVAALEVSPSFLSQAAASVASIRTASKRQRTFAVFFIKSTPFLK